MLASALLSAILEPLTLIMKLPPFFGNDGDRAPGNEAQAFQKTPGFILAMDFVDLANIADVEHGEWHGACMNQIRKEVSFIKLISQ